MRHEELRESRYLERRERGGGEGRGGDEEREKGKRRKRRKGGVKGDGVRGREGGKSMACSYFYELINSSFSPAFFLASPSLPSPSLPSPALQQCCCIGSYELET